MNEVSKGQFVQVVKVVPGLGLKGRVGIIRQINSDSTYLVVFSDKENARLFRDDFVPVSVPGLDNGKGGDTTVAG